MVNMNIHMFLCVCIVLSSNVYECIMHRTTYPSYVYVYDYYIDLGYSVQGHHTILSWRKESLQ